MCRRGLYRQNMSLGEDNLCLYVISCCTSQPDVYNQSIELKSLFVGTASFTFEYIREAKIRIKKEIKNKKECLTIL